MTFPKIEQTSAYSWNNQPGDKVLYHDSQDDITALLMGRSVREVDGDQMQLDDGTVVKVIPNEGGCACSAGDYELEYLNRAENVITRVEFDYEPTGDGNGSSFVGGEWVQGYYRIFVFAGDERVNLLSVTGDDGNGYYGTGFELIVRPTGEKS